MSALYQALPAVDKLLKTPQGEQFIAEFGHTATVNSGLGFHRFCFLQSAFFFRFFLGLIYQFQTGLPPFRRVP